MDKEEFMKVIKFIFVLVAIVAVSYFAYLKLGGDVGSSREKGFEFIERHINSNGELKDITNDIGVRSYEDIKLFIKDDFVKIEYGKVALKWKLEDFTKKENLDRLKRIGIDVYRDKDSGRLRVFYKGEELERWVD